MSAICQSFVQNAWRKDICSNCFRVRDEHPTTEGEKNSVKCGTSPSGPVGAENNGVNTPSIVPSPSSNGKAGNEANGVLSNGHQNADGCGGSEGNRGNSHQWSSAHKFHRFQNQNHNTPNPTTPFSQQATTQGSSSNGTSSSSGIPRISNGTPVNVGSGVVAGASAKFSGTNSSPTTKGHVHSTLSGSRSSIHSSGNNLNETKEAPAAETNYGTRVRSSSAVMEATISKSLSSSASSLFFPNSSSNHHHHNHHHQQPHLITSQQQQGKGVMTNQHPSKGDNSAGSVILPPNHHSNNRQPMTSSAQHQSSTSASTSSTSSSSTANTSPSRNISSFIASKNLFNNAAATSGGGNAAVVGSAVSPPVPDTTGFTKNVDSATTAHNVAATSGFGSNIITTTTNTTTSTSTNGSASSNISNGPVITVAVAGAGSSGLGFPQSTNSIKRGNIAVSSSSSGPALVLASSSSGSSSSSSSSSVIQPSHHQKNCAGGFDVVVGYNSALTSNHGGGGGGSHHSRNLENCVKNGVIENHSNNSGKKNAEFLAEVTSNSNVCNISVSNSGNKGASATIAQLTQQIGGMNRGKVSSLASAADAGDPQLHDGRRKVGFSPSSSSTSVSGGGDGGSGTGGGNEPVNVSKNYGKVVARPEGLSGKKGILRSKNNGNRRRDKNVRFPEKVVEVIGYGGGPSGISDDEDDTPTNPLDNSSVSEIMEKNSTTMEDKELHRQTQKNTNFNSIKTNLLGTTCIEIGPIVGCTGGKSMEGSTKPLVSISTFEARKEPLKIQKKICEDSADDELNEKTVEKHRKFIPRGGGGGSNVGTSSSTTGKTLLTSSTSSSSQVSGKSKEIETKQQTATTTPVTKGILKTTSHSATSASSTSYNSTSSTTITAINKPGHLSSSKSSSSTSNLSSSLSLTKGSGSSTTTIEVNPEQLSSTTTSSLRSSKESIAVKSGGLSGTVASRISSSSGAASKWSTGGPSAIPTTTNTSISGNNETSTLRSTNKPVLKRIQQKNANSESTPASEGTTSSTSSYTVNAAVVETSKNPASANLNGRNNLVILTNGNNNSKSSSAIVGSNNVSNSIASQRNSFLRDIFVDSSAPTKDSGAVGETEFRRDPSAPSNGVQVICKNNASNLHGNKTNQDGALSSSIKSELKVDLKPSVNNGKLSHPPFGECLSNRSNGTDDSSEFDDSLEDSGLDIKKCSEISESDEKSGSGSDSGNENDYSDRDRVKIISATGPKSGLFISVDEVEGTSKKPEKLSPDSVLFSSASEMSASGSSESIPEALDTLSNGSSQKSSGSSSTSGNDSGTSASAAVKRAAPRPPTNSVSEGTSKGNNGAIYANSQQSSTFDAEGLYDDVSFYKNPFSAKKDNKIPAFEEEDEENIYDDCNTITAIPKGGKSSGAKSAMGSYSFQNGSSNALDSDVDEEVEKVVQRRSDGIEFIGIRKIDSESFLRERSPTPDRSPEGKRERSSSASPKTRRKVNQFFSTIGKKAGAAFSNHVHGYSSKNKSSPVIEETGIEKSPSGNSSAYKRSLSTDEVSMTRTQEIYATLTPTSLKFKGLAPVLHKLSRMELSLGDRDKGMSSDLDDDSKEKGYKKHKLSTSIKKFLRFGSKDGGETSGHKYEFGNCPNKTETNGTGQMITSQISEESVTDMNPSSRTPTPTLSTSNLSSSTQAMKLHERKPSAGTMSGRPPPPPPPRVHSLDLLNRVGVAGPNGTVRPARPPPPARHNRVAPSFTSVFNNPPNTSSENKSNGEGNGTTTIIISGNSTSYQDLPDPNNPPSKPKRKASINLECVSNGISRDLETTYNHITTLNLETLKLIASQTPTKIRSSVAFNKRNSNKPLRWSQFHISEPSKPLIHGHGFVVYSALLEDDSCTLLIQESATAPNFSAPFEFPCVETSATFEDNIPCSFITWKASEYVTNGSNVKVFVSVMPKYSMYTVETYMRNRQVPLLHKYFALLQAMKFWDNEEMSDLLVLVQSMDDSDSFMVPSSPSSVLVYVHPIPHLSTGGKIGGRRSSSKTQLSVDFESAMRQILLNSGSISEGTQPLLGNNDRQVLLKRLNENTTRSAQDQFRLFLQVKLFTPKRDSEDLERIKKLRSERAIQQWLDRERAMCMKEAVEQTLQRNIVHESSISPYKRSYLEFLLTPENSAKAVLDMLIDLLE